MTGDSDSSDGIKRRSRPLRWQQESSVRCFGDHVGGAPSSAADVTVFGRRLTSAVVLSDMLIPSITGSDPKYELRGVRSADWTETVVAATRNIGRVRPKGKSFCRISQSSCRREAWSSSPLERRTHDLVLPVEACQLVYGRPATRRARARIS